MNLKTLDEAVRQGWLTIREKDEAEVPVVLVRNDSSYRVFLMCGEIIAGGWQNRMVKEDVLLGPRSGFVEIPVYCGERGRWLETKAGFESARILAHPGLRKRAAADESQNAIWSEIEGHSARLGVASPTHDYRRSHEESGVRDKLDDYARRFRHLPRFSTVGLVAATGGRILGCDIFSDSELFLNLWEKLLRSYASEVVSEHRKESGEITPALVRRYLLQVFSAGFREKSTPGEGYLLCISGSIQGAALVWRGEVVHAFFVGDSPYCPVLPRPPRPIPPIPFRRLE